MEWAITVLGAVVTALTTAVVVGAWRFLAAYHEITANLLAVNERLREDNQHLAQARTLGQYQQLTRVSRRSEPLLVTDHRPPKEPRHHDDRRDAPVPVGVGINA
jgi:hypothetical protein